METLTTNDIRVSIKTSYRDEYSKPKDAKFIHTYQIQIENLGTTPVQLMRRHWIIKDSNGELRELEGDGVVGQQPLLEPGASHRYTSWCSFSTEIGLMQGSFKMYDLLKEEFFKVIIPTFRLIAPMKLN